MKHDGRKPTLAELAGSATEAVRALSQRTFPYAGEITAPADIDSIIASIKIMADRLPQLVGQLSGWLERAHEDGRIAHDTRRDPAPYVTVVRRSLGLAEADAVMLASELSTAHDAISGLLMKDDPANTTKNPS